MLSREKQGFVVKNHCSPCSWTDCCWSERCTPSLSAERPPLSAPAYYIQSVHPGKNRKVTVFNHQVSVLTSKNKKSRAKPETRTKHWLAEERSFIWPCLTALQGFSRSKWAFERVTAQDHVPVTMFVQIKWRIKVCDHLLKKNQRNFLPFYFFLDIW